VILGRRPVWVQVILPPADNDPAQAIRERRWIDADGNQWRTNERPLTPAPIVG
jgi:hypothetical protein